MGPAGAKQADRRVFVGVTDPIEPEVETSEQAGDRILLAIEHIPLTQPRAERFNLRGKTGRETEGACTFRRTVAGGTRRRPGD
jgi:hypothetical protein